MREFLFKKKRFGNYVSNICIIPGLILRVRGHHNLCLRIGAIAKKKTLEEPGLQPTFSQRHAPHCSIMKGSRRSKKDVVDPPVESSNDLCINAVESFAI